MNCTKCGRPTNMLTNGKCPGCGPSTQLLPPPELKKQATKAKRAKKQRQPSSLESAFNALAKLAALPPYETEYRFAPPRRWRFDMAWPEEKVAVELEGGIWTGGRHSRGKGMQEDMEKYNAATSLGWKVLRYSTNDLRDKPLVMMEQVKQALGLPF